MAEHDLKFAAFKGKSLTSRVIRFFTRSEYSHIAIVDGEDLIEAWNHAGGVRNWWDFSGFDKHEAGTPYEIWALPSSAQERLFCMKQYRSFGIRKRRYDWQACLGFVFHAAEEDREGAMCSEGAIQPIVTHRKYTFKPSKVSPDFFVMLMQMGGARIVERGIVNG